METLLRKIALFGMAYFILAVIVYGEMAFIPLAYYSLMCLVGTLQMWYYEERNKEPA